MKRSSLSSVAIIQLIDCPMRPILKKLLIRHLPVKKGGKIRFSKVTRHHYFGRNSQRDFQIPKDWAGSNLGQRHLKLQRVEEWKQQNSTDLLESCYLEESNRATSEIVGSLLEQLLLPKSKRDLTASLIRRTESRIIMMPVCSGSPFGTCPS